MHRRPMHWCIAEIPMRYCVLRVCLTRVVQIVLRERSAASVRSRVVCRGDFRVSIIGAVYVADFFVTHPPPSRYIPEIYDFVPSAGLLAPTEPPAPAPGWTDTCDKSPIGLRPKLEDNFRETTRRCLNPHGCAWSFVCSCFCLLGHVW